MIEPIAIGREVLAMLKACAVYDPATGIFTRLKSTASNARAGQRCGTINRASGYRHIWVGGQLYRANRLAWLWMTGDWPPGLVDHRNGVEGDDRWSNLRLATYPQNCANSKRRIDNTSGFKGVKSQRGRWLARIGAGGGRCLGTFDTPEEAHEAYVRAAVETYGEFARAA